MKRSQTGMPALAIEVSPGELLDKISILEIKSENIQDSQKLSNVRYELDLYREICKNALPIDDTLAGLMRDLKAANAALWKIEDDIRACESRQDFGDEFIRLARSVYRTNDRRAALKRKINVICGSSIIEEKSYTDY